MIIQGATVPTTTYTITDHLNTASLEFSDAGTLVWQGALFGQELDSSPNFNRYHFTGKERDTESGLGYFGARYLSTSMGRWMSPDWSPNPVPIPFGDIAHPQTLNLYGYAGNNPLSNIDIDGHLECASNTQDVACAVTAAAKSVWHWLTSGGGDSGSNSNAGNTNTSTQADTASSPIFHVTSRILPTNVGLGYGGSFTLGAAIPHGDNALAAGQVSVDALNDTHGSALAGTYGGTIPLGPPGNTHPGDPSSWGGGIYAGTSAHVTFGNGSLAEVKGPSHTINANLAWMVEIGGFSYSYSGHTWQMTVSLPGTGPGWDAELTQYKTTTCMVGNGVKGC